MAVIKRLSSKATPTKLVNYLTQEEKTEEKLISGKDCSPENVLEEFKATKELYEKNNGVQYHHIIQSFDPNDNITPEKAHEIGKELAENQFKGHEVLIVTHRDKDHIHNHLVVNSVNFENGKKYNATKQSLREIKKENDRLCGERGLSVIKESQNKDYWKMQELQPALKGQSWKVKLMSSIDKAKELSSTKEEFIKNMNKLGYEVIWKDSRKNITFIDKELKELNDKLKAEGKKGVKYKVRDTSLHSKEYTKGALENEFTRTESQKSKPQDRGIGERHSGIQQSNQAINRTEPNIKTGIREFSTEGVFDTITRTIEEISRKAGQEPERTERTIQRNGEQDRAVKEQQRATERTNEPRVRERDFEIER